MASKKKTSTKVARRPKHHVICRSVHRANIASLPGAVTADLVVDGEEIGIVHVCPTAPGEWNSGGRVVESFNNPWMTEELKSEVAYVVSTAWRMRLLDERAENRDA